jgi:ectoine hydroxylase-related dioxygenase (phytanoyl-CoA dioxygenase family)
MRKTEPCFTIVRHGRVLTSIASLFFDSSAAFIATQLMKSAQINFYYDAVFVRSPGSQFTTHWHQDEPYWSVNGYDARTIWMQLVPVKRENALA